MFEAIMILVAGIIVFAVIFGISVVSLIAMVIRSLLGVNEDE